MMILGIDVGGTSTDAVLLNAAGLSGKAKMATTSDVSTGIVSAIGDLRRHHDGGTSLVQDEEVLCMVHMQCYQQLITRPYLDHRMQQQ